MNAPAQRRLSRRIFLGLTAVAILAVVGIAGLFGALWLEHRTRTELPAPTGTFPVSRAIYDWVDNKTVDVLAPRTKREVLVWIWYPAAANGSAVPEDYLPEPMRTGIAQQRGVLFLQFLTRDLSKVRVHSVRDALVSPVEQSYPVVIARAGASLEIANYSTLTEDLASHGYVVVGIDAPYRTGIVAFPDGRVVKRADENNPERCLEKEGEGRERCVDRIISAWDSDIGYVLDRLAQLNASDPSGKLTGKLDLTRVGIFGHSFGGAQATQFCSQDPRCRAGLDVDGAPHGSVIQSGIPHPFMFLLGDHRHEPEDETRQVATDIQSVYGRIPANERLYVTIRGANHFSFSDDGAMLKSHLVRGVLRGIGVLGMDGERQLAVTASCLRTFFDAYLKQSSVSAPNLASPLYPEIQLLQ
jgi:predicted dienelactone hydrolase